MRAALRINPFRHMKHLLLSLFLLTTLSFEKAKAQVEPSLVRTDEGCLLEFFGEFGSAYFYQWSTDLTNWTYLPRADPGDEPISLGFECNQPEFFLRLVTEDFLGSDPETFDFDGDGLPSLQELLASPQTDPFNADTDGDQLSDGFEFFNGLNGASSDQNNNGIPDSLDDFDGDGANNSDEQNNGGNPNDAIDGGEGVLSAVSAEEDEEQVNTRSYSIPAGGSNYVVFAYVHSEEYPEFTEDSSEFDDVFRWEVTSSNGQNFSNSISVNTLHPQWVQAEQEGFSINGLSPVAYEILGTVESSPQQTVTVDVEVGVTNVSDSRYPSTVQVALQRLDLSVREDTLTLLEENTLEVQGLQNFPDEIVGAIQFEIRFEDKDEWHIIENGEATSFTGTARVAGKFKVRAIVEVGDMSAKTPEESIEVQFPDCQDIIRGPGVRERMDEAWQNTLATTTTEKRREEGYYITLSTRKENQGYNITRYTVGRKVNNNETAFLNGFGGPRPDDIPNDPNPLQSAIYVVGWFHTHTPTTYRVGSLREVGPSGGDISFSLNSSRNVPGYAYDYEPTTFSSNGGIAIYFGHPLNAPADVYDIPPNRRPTP